MTRLRFATFWALGVGLVLALAGAVAAPADEPAAGWGFVPAEPDSDGPVLQGTTWVSQSLGHGIWFKHLDDDERLAYLERQTGVAVDPWATPEGKEPRFMSFLLILENSSDVRMEFNPLHSWLMTNKQDIQTPMNLTDMSFDYRFNNQDLPEAYEKVRPVLLGETRTVEVGEKISGLLVYKVVRSRTKNFTIDVRLTLHNGDVVRFAARYRRPPKEKKGKNAK